MKEKHLKEYFENKLTAKLLAADLKDSQQKTGYDSTIVHIDTIQSGEFAVLKDHIIKVLDDAIVKKLLPQDLNTIGYAILTSDYFIWDSEPEFEERIVNILNELASPEIGHDLTIKNFQLWKDYLLTGEYRLDTNELKQKFRSKGKYKELYQKVDEILWEDWDPIGVNDSAPRDKYQGYIPIIFNLRKKNAVKEIIAQKLYELETNELGLPGNIEHCRQVADKIKSLKY